TEVSLTIRKARLLWSLGEYKQAIEHFDEIAGKLTSPDDLAAIAEALQAEMRLHRVTAARGHAADSFAALADRQQDAIAVRAQWLREIVFPGHGQDAATWWTFLNGKFADEPARQRMRRLQNLLDPSAGESPPEQLKEWADLLSRRKVVRDWHAAA